MLRATLGTIRCRENCYSMHSRRVTAPVGDKGHRCRQTLQDTAGREAEEAQEGVHARVHSVRVLAGLPRDILAHLHATATAHDRATNVSLKNITSGGHSRTAPVDQKHHKSSQHTAGTPAMARHHAVHKKRGGAQDQHLDCLGRRLYTPALLRQHKVLREKRGGVRTQGRNERAGAVQGEELEIQAPEDDEADADHREEKQVVGAVVYVMVGATDEHLPSHVIHVSPEGIVLFYLRREEC